VEQPTYGPPGPLAGHLAASRRAPGGVLRIVAAITDADEIARVLHGARQAPRPPPPGQLGFFDP